MTPNTSSYGFPNSSSAYSTILGRHHLLHQEPQKSSHDVGREQREQPVRAPAGREQRTYAPSAPAPAPAACGVDLLGDLEPTPADVGIAGDFNPNGNSSATKVGSCWWICDGRCCQICYL